MKPRILILSTAYAPHWGGAEIAIKEITDRLANQYDFFMLTPKLDRGDADREKVGHIVVKRIGVGGTKSKYAFTKNASKIFQKMHTETQFDLMWAMMASHAGIAGMRIKQKFPHLPYLLTLQSGDSDFFWRIRTLWWKKWFKQVYISPDHIQAISSFLTKRARSYGYDGPVSEIPNGVDTNIFRVQDSKYQKQSVQIVSQSIGIKEDEKVIITTSRLVEKNAIDVLIRSLEHVTTKVKLLVIGTGDKEKSLKKLAQKLKMKKQVVFLGHVTHRDLPQYLAISDVFVRASRSEGLGNSFLEAMAVGVPIVGTRVGGIIEFLIDRETGLYCNVNDPKDTAKAINELLENDDLRKRIIEKAHRTIAQKYEWNSIATKVGDIFTDLKK